MILPRLIDKARAALAGTLGDYYDGPKGMNGHFLRFVGLEHAALKRVIAKGWGDAEILAWIERHAKFKRQPWEITQPRSSSMNSTNFLDAINTLKLYRRAELIDADGDALVEELYVDPLPGDHVLRTILHPNTTFLVGRKGTGKSTIFQIAQKRLDQDSRITWAYDMLCPKCKTGRCRVVNLSRKYEKLINEVATENLLPGPELGILKTLHDERREMFAKEIAGELDCSYQLVGSRGKNLAERDLVVRRENEQGRRTFSIRESANEIYFKKTSGDAMDFGEAEDRDVPPDY